MPTVAAAADQARTLFQKGTDLFAGEKYEEAVEAFRAAYAVRPSWKLLFNIGQAEAAARRYGQALEAFEQYLAEAGDEISLERQQEVQNEARRLREMVGTLMVTAPSGAMILVDDLERGTAPMPDGILVSAGVSHGLKAVIDGKVVAESEARVRVGASVTVDLNGTTDSPAAPVGAASKTESSRELHVSQDAIDKSSPNERSHRLRNVGIALLATGGAIVAGGAITGGLALKKENELKDRCMEGDVCDDSQQDRIDSRDALGITSTVLFSAGAAAVVAGIVFLAVSKKSRAERVSVAPLLHPRAGGLTAVVQF